MHAPSIINGAVTVKKQAKHAEPWAAGRGVRVTGYACLTLHVDFLALLVASDIALLVVRRFPLRK